MDVGIHLPQYGRVSADPEAVARVARHAEELGFAGIWVSDHIVQPAAQDYPSPYLYDPLVALTWGAAVTTHIGLGTSVLVVPQHNPLELANSLASLDVLSQGRLTVGVGAGWSQGEYEALGYEFTNRGRRLDETLSLWRTVWRDDPASFHGRYHQFEDLRVLPKPAHDIPIWVGGSGSAAHRRAIEHGDGIHLISLTPDEAAAVVEKVRSERPEDSFVVSLRTGWDPQGMPADQIRAEREAYAEAGVSYVVAAPWRNSLDDWLRSMDLLAELARLDAR